MSVSILYYKLSQERISSAQQSEQIANWVEELPAIKQQQIKNLRKKDDQVLSLAGLQLLKLAMPTMSSSPFFLNQIQFPLHAKPFINDHIDFNISHSGNIVCCAVSNSIKVGIDIERQRAVKPATLKKFLTEKSSTPVENNQQQFFNLWTKNEAIIKAANHGSIYNMHEIEHEKRGGYYQSQFWHTYPVDILSAEDDNEYTCHLACSEKIDNIHRLKAKQIYTL